LTGNFEVIGAANIEVLFKETATEKARDHIESCKLLFRM